MDYGLLVKIHAVDGIFLFWILIDQFTICFIRVEKVGE